MEKKEFDISKSICRYEISNRPSFGFFIKIFKEYKYLPCLITSNHLITKEMIDNKYILNISFDNGQIKGQIQLSKDERYILDLSEINNDLLLIELLKKDNIGDDYFLLPDLRDAKRPEKLKNENIEIPQSLLNGKLNYTQLKIDEIKNNDFIYSIKVNEDFCGCPIFRPENNKVIGILMPNENNEDKKSAVFIHPIFEFLNNEYTHEKGGIEFKEAGDYYQGDLKSDIPNGKGILYCKNGDIYKGEFINGKKEGKGNYIKENGEYYIGQWKNDLKFGKGTLYGKNCNIIYEINSKAKGNLILIMEFII